MKTISIHQPNYIPWLGYFYKISQSNVFVFTGDSKFSTSGMHNYNYIKTPKGLFRLKIPVEYEKGTNAQINQVRTKDELNWKNDHLLKIEHNYKKAKHFNEVFSDFSDLLLREYSNLAIMNQEIIMFFCEKLGIMVDFECSSSLNITTKREEKIIDICKTLDGNIYYSGSGAKVYQNEENFKKNGIELIYSDFRPFNYYQSWGSFESKVTILDYLVEYGYDWQRVMDNVKKQNDI